MAKYGIEGLGEIKPLELPYFSTFLNDNPLRDQKINEIVEKVNILIRLKIDKISQENKI